MPSKEEGPGWSERNSYLQFAAFYGIWAAHSANEQTEAAEHERSVWPAHTDQCWREHAPGSGCRFTFQVISLISYPCISFSDAQPLKCVCSVCYRSVSDSPACTRGHSDCREDSWWPEQWASHPHHTEKDQWHHSKEQRALSNKPSGKTHSNVLYSH